MRGLEKGQEYFNPVILEFLLFNSEEVPNVLSIEDNIAYDDISIVCSRKRGNGVQHEYLIRINRHSWNKSKQYAINQLREKLSQSFCNPGVYY